MNKNGYTIIVKGEDITTYTFQIPFDGEVGVLIETDEEDKIHRVSIEAESYIEEIKVIKE